MGGWVMKVEEMACSLFSGRKRLNLGSGIAEVMPHVAFRRQILALIDLLDFLACETVAGQRIWRLALASIDPLHQSTDQRTGTTAQPWISFSPSMFSAMTNRSRRAFWSVGL